ncbi:MAG: hypothetical protein DMG31_03965 [Acidobacteria bacterium]|nr:MAG: hypothetical protein DMG31_03965 [Acidobacteriota bacterium]
MYAIIPRLLRSSGPLLCVVVFAGLSASAQGLTSEAPTADRADLGSKIAALTHSIEQMQGELQQSRLEIQQLRNMLTQILRTQANPPPSNPPDEHAAERTQPQNPETNAPLARITEDDWQILNARVEEHEQVKVESSAKYRLKISGIALFNVFDTSGQLDNLDVPTVAVQPPPYAYTGSLAASFRQSVVGLRGIGPRVFGASTSADFQLDFINSAAGPYGGVAAGLVGLRIARLQFDWSKISITGGLETPFFSPNSPTSYLSLAVPAFAAAGNLWYWTPAIRAERRFDFTSAELKVEAGVLDSAGYSVSGSNERVPTPGEYSRQPVYAVRLSGNNRMEDHAISFGISGIYAPLRFPNRQAASASGAIADWKFPLIAKLQLSGAFFTGKGLDGFGGLALSTVQPQDYQHYLYATAPTLAGIPVIGGWSQLKFTVNRRSEFNAAGGLGTRDAARLRTATQFDPLLRAVPSSNRIFFFNYIFRPRGDLLFSAEYRHFRTSEILGGPNVAGQVGLAAGFLF